MNFQLIKCRKKSLIAPKLVNFWYKLFLIANKIISFALIFYQRSQDSISSADGGNFREWDRGSLKTCSCQFLENEFLWQCILNLLGRDFQSFMTLVKYSDINLGMKWISFVSRLQSKTFIFLANYTYSEIPSEQKVIF